MTTNAERLRLLYERRRLTGVCRACGKEPLRPGRTTGEACARAAAERGREDRRRAAQERELAGEGRWRERGPARPNECIRCRNPPAPGSRLCVLHQQVMAEAGQEFDLGAPGARR
jgi:hypothetical protein